MSWCISKHLSASAVCLRDHWYNSNILCLSKQSFQVVFKRDGTTYPLEVFPSVYHWKFTFQLDFSLKVFTCTVSSSSLAGNPFVSSLNFKGSKSNTAERCIKKEYLVCFIWLVIHTSFSAMILDKLTCSKSLERFWGKDIWVWILLDKFYKSVYKLWIL